MNNRTTLKDVINIYGERTPGAAGKHKYFSVLVPLVEKDGQLHLLYELRAAHMKRQPGEICFPGGHMETGETAEECALRETQEELSIPPSAVQILGNLDFLCHRSGFVLYPVLARVDAQALKHLVCNPAEVDEMFLVPLSTLRSMPQEQYRYELIPALGDDFPFERIGIPRDYRWKKGVETFPVYCWQDKAIWGLTGRITRHLLSLLDEERE